MSRGKKGSASLFRPSPRHQTIHVRFSGPRTDSNRRGRYVESTGIPWTDDRDSKAWKAAEELARKKEREFLNADEHIAPQVIQTKKPVRDWAEAHLADLRMRSGPAWSKRAGYLLGTAVKTFGHLRPSAVTTEQIERYQRKRLDAGVSASTIKAELTLLLAALKRAHRAHAIGELPYLKHVKASAQKKPKQPREYLSWPRIAEILSTLKKSFPAFADFAEAFALSGVRPRALGRVTIDMVDVARGRIVIPAAMMKEPRDHEIPLLGGFASVVARRLGDQASSGLLFHDGSGRSLLGSDSKLGLSEAAMLVWRAAAPDGFEFYSLRGCCASRAEQGGATDVKVSALLSHSRGMNSTYSLASNVWAAMAAAEKRAAAELKNPAGLVAVRQRIDAGGR